MTPQALQSRVTELARREARYASQSGSDPKMAEWCRRQRVEAERQLDEAQLEAPRPGGPTLFDEVTSCR